MVADFIGLVNFIDGDVRGDRVFIKGSNVSFPNNSDVKGAADYCCSSGKYHHVP